MSSSSKRSWTRIACVVVSFVVVGIAAAVVVDRVFLSESDDDSSSTADQVPSCARNGGEIDECSFCIDGVCVCPPGLNDVGRGCPDNVFALDVASASPTNETHWQSQGWSVCAEECQRDGGMAARQTRHIFCETISFTNEGIIASTVVDAEECDTTTPVGGDRSCNAFTCGLARIEMSFEIEIRYEELVWSLSSFDAFEAVLYLEMHRLMVDIGSVGVELLEVVPNTSGASRLKIGVTPSTADVDTEALLQFLLLSLQSASSGVDFFGTSADMYHYLTLVFPETVSGSVIATQYCDGSNRCENLRRSSCSDTFGECGPCKEGFIVDDSNPELSTNDGSLQCFPRVDCTYASSHYCATSLSRQPCSRTANTCGPCLPGFDGINRHGDGNQECEAVSVDCSGTDAEYCASLLRMPCQNTHNTCGPCVPGSSMTGEVVSVGGDGNAPCVPLVESEMEDVDGVAEEGGNGNMNDQDDEDVTVEPGCGEDAPPCGLLNRHDCSVVPHSTCGECLKGFVGVPGPSNTRCLPAGTFLCSDLDFAGDFCASKNRESCTVSNGEFLCGQCLNGFRSVAASPYLTYALSQGPSNDECVEVEVDCSEAPDCKTMYNRLSCSEVANTCGPCLSGFFGESGPGNTICTHQTADCSMAPDCALLHREECREADNTCGVCEDGFEGDAGNANSECILVQITCDIMDEEACTALNRLPCGSTPETCGVCRGGFEGIAGPSNTKCYPSHPIVADCSASPDCKLLGREECAAVDGTCGPCLDGLDGEPGHSNTQCITSIASCDDAIERVECMALNRHSCSSIDGVCGPCKAGFDSTIEGPSNLLCTALDDLVDCTQAPNCDSLHRLECKVVENTCGDCQAGFFGAPGNGNGHCTLEADRSNCSIASTVFCDDLNRLPCSSVPNMCGPCQPGYFTQFPDFTLDGTTDFGEWEVITEHPSVVANSQTHANDPCFAAGDLVHLCASTPPAFCESLNRNPCDGRIPNTCGSCLTGHGTKDESGLSASNSLCIKNGVDCSLAQTCSTLNRQPCSTDDNECGECMEGYVEPQSSEESGCVLDRTRCSPAHCNFGGVCILADQFANLDGTGVQHGPGAGEFYCVCDPSRIDVGDEQCALQSPSYVSEWVASGWSTCSQNCGGGIRTRSVECKLISPDGEMIENGDETLDITCIEANKPESTQLCGLMECGKTQALIHLEIFPPSLSFAQLETSAAMTDAFEISVILEIAEALGVPPARFSIEHLSEVYPYGVGIDLLIHPKIEPVDPSVADIVLQLIVHLGDETSALRNNGQWFVYVDSRATSFRTFTTDSTSVGAEDPDNSPTDSPKEVNTPLIVGATFGICGIALVAGFLTRKTCRSGRHEGGSGMEIVCEKELTDMKAIEAYPVNENCTHEDTFFDGDVVARAYPLTSVSSDQHGKVDFEQGIVEYSSHATSKLSSAEMAVKLFQAARKDVADAIKCDQEQKLFEAHQMYSRAIFHFDDYLLHETDTEKKEQVSRKVAQYRERSAVIQQVLGEDIGVNDDSDDEADDVNIFGHPSSNQKDSSLCSPNQPILRGSEGELRPPQLVKQEQQACARNTNSTFQVPTGFEVNDDNVDDLEHEFDLSSLPPLVTHNIEFRESGGKVNEELPKFGKV